MLISWIRRAWSCSNRFRIRREMMICVRRAHLTCTQAVSMGTFSVDIWHAHASLSSNTRRISIKQRLLCVDDQELTIKLFHVSGECLCGARCVGVVLPCCVLSAAVRRFWSNGRFLTRRISEPACRSGLRSSQNRLWIRPNTGRCWGNHFSKVIFGKVIITSDKTGPKRRHPQS